MDREIKFRGLRRDGLGWAYGYICPEKDGDMNIITEQPWKPIFRFKVHPKTVGQFTGLKDKNGKEIFDGDVVRVKTKHGFHSDLLNEFKERNNLDTINEIGLHFKGVIRIDVLRGLMFENQKNGYQEPVFSRHIEIKNYLSEIEVFSNIHEQ